MEKIEDIKDIWKHIKTNEKIKKERFTKDF